MKKLFALLSMLICAVLLSSTAFTADKDAYVLYQKYLKKMKTVSSMEISGVEKSFYFKDGQFEVDTKFNMSAKILITPDNKPQMEMQWVVSETKEKQQAYFKDGYLYYKSPALQLKHKTTLKKNKTGMNSSLADILYLRTDLTKDDLKDAKLEKVEDGTKITYKIPPETNSSNGITTKTSVTASMTLADDGMLKAYSHSSVYITTYSDDRSPLHYKTTQSLKVKSVNSVTKINFPSNLSTYKDR